MQLNAQVELFMFEETEFIEELSNRVRMGMQCLVEIHSHYQTQIDIAARCDSVYDLLYLRLYYTIVLKMQRHWHTGFQFRQCNCFTVPDTHDGIGIVDVGASGDKPVCLPQMRLIV